MMFDQINIINLLNFLPYSYEKLYKKENIYDIILVLNYNMNPIKKNKGSAIFIHVSKKILKIRRLCCTKRFIHKILKN